MVDKILGVEKLKAEKELAVSIIMEKFINENLVVKKGINKEIFVSREIKCIEDIIKVVKDKKCS